MILNVKFNVNYSNHENCSVKLENKQCSKSLLNRSINEYGLKIELNLQAYILKKHPQNLLIKQN